MTSLQDRRITLRSDPYWPDRFEDERERIQNVSDGGLRGVFHVGSTAIRDVPGKPALDVLAVYADEDSMARAMERLAADDEYERAGESTVLVRWTDGYAVFVKMHTTDDPKVRNQLLFRDYLRDHPDARAEYARLKREAAETHPEDPEAYTDAKSAVVRSILEQARADGYAERLPEFA